MEWACYGNAFIAGDEVELQVVAPDAWVREKYGERGASVDAHETHHQVGADDAPTTAVRGRVRGIEAIYLGHTVRHEPRDPRDLAERQAEHEAELAELQRAARGDSDDAGEVRLAWMIGPPKPYTVTLTPVPGAVRTVPVTRVPRTAPDPAAEEKTRLVHEADEPPSGPVELFSGYLVELDPV